MALLFLTTFLLQVVVSYTYFVQTTNPNCVCGHTNNDVGTRIVGGAIVDAHRFPWMAAILVEGVLFCGGALINDRYVLTAGHCVRELGPTMFTIALGVHDLSNLSEGVVVPAIQSKIHPDFYSEPVRDLNDIGLIKLKYPVNFTTNIRPICLPMRDRNYTNLKAELAGWGNTQEGGEESSRFLKETTVNIISLEDCAKTKNRPYINGKMLCTYTEHTDACQGDSGGPLLLQRRKDIYETIGIVSWGFGCARKESPGVSTKVFSFLDWIIAETQDSIYCMNE